MTPAHRLLALALPCVAAHAATAHRLDEYREATTRAVATDRARAGGG